MKIDIATAAPPALSAGNLTMRLRAQLPEMTDVAAAVARQILDDPAGVTTCSIGELALLCGTSPASVTRFCRALGLSGYPELKLRIAGELGQASATAWDQALGATVGEGDRPERVAAIVAAANAATLKACAETLDHAALERAAAAIAACGRVTFFGVGASLMPAQEAQRLLFRIGRPAWCCATLHDGLLAAALSGAGDVFFAISRSGRTHEVVDAQRAARARGATTIGLSAFATAPLAEASDILLLTPAENLAAGHAALAVKYAQMLVIDCLYSLIAQRDYSRATDALAATARALAPYRGARRRAATPRRGEPA